MQQNPSCDVTYGAPEARFEPDLRALLADLRVATESHREVGGSFPLSGIGNLFEHLDGLDAVASAGLRLTAEESDAARAVLINEITATGDNTKVERLASVLRKLPRP